MNVVIKGVIIEIISRHKANYIQVFYSDYQHMANKACRIKAAALNELGFKVHFYGDFRFQ